ncbi:MAG: recombinase family protein [Polyangiaceae bacterium]
MHTTLQNHSAIVGRRVVGYSRVSTDEQAQGGVSLDAQRAQISAYTSLYGLNCVEFKCDVASGALCPEKRPGLAAALALVKQGAADGVVVVKLDRLSRSTTDILNLVAQASREEWRLVSVSEQLDTASAAGRFTVTVLAAMSEMERGIISERTRAAMNQIAAQGRARSRWLQFGYRVEGHPTKTELTKGERGQLVEHPGEQRLLRKILALKSRGLGPHAIASRLNARGLLNPRTGRAWSVGGVGAILTTALRADRAVRSKRPHLIATRRGKVVPNSGGSRA